MRAASTNGGAVRRAVRASERTAAGCMRWICAVQSRREVPGVMMPRDSQPYFTGDAPPFAIP